MGVFIVATVGSFNDWQKEKQFLRLQAESEKDNTVSEQYSTSHFMVCFLCHAWLAILALEILTDCYIDCCYSQWP